MSYLIVSLVSFVCGCAGAAYLFRRNHRNSISRYQALESQLQEGREALQEIMYLTHHQGINPICKRIRGLSTLGLMVSARLMNYLDLLSKPHHQEYSKLAMHESQEILKYFKLIENEAKDLETDTLNKIKEFEHLQ